MNLKIDSLAAFASKVADEDKIGFYRVSGHHSRDANGKVLVAHQISDRFAILGRPFVAETSMDLSCIETWTFDPCVFDDGALGWGWNTPEGDDDRSLLGYSRHMNGRDDVTSEMLEAAKRDRDHWHSIVTKQPKRSALDRNSQFEISEDNGYLDFKFNGAPMKASDWMKRASSILEPDQAKFLYLRYGHRDPDSWFAYGGDVCLDYDVFAEGLESRRGSIQSRLQKLAKIRQ